jgi:hypothetical protein
MRPGGRIARSLLVAKSLSFSLSRYIWVYA